MVPICHAYARLVTPNEARLDGLLHRYTAQSVLPKPDNEILRGVCGYDINLLRHDKPAVRAMDVREQVEFILEDNVTVSLRIVLCGNECRSTDFCVLMWCIWHDIWL